VNLVPRLATAPQYRKTAEKPPSQTRHLDPSSAILSAIATGANSFRNKRLKLRLDNIHDYMSKRSIMWPSRQSIFRELRRGLICALLIATLWSTIYWVMGISIISAVLAAAVATIVRFAVPAG
jgi:uncharacterized protein YacL